MMGLQGEKELTSFFVFDTQYSIIPTFHQSIGPLFPHPSWNVPAGAKPLSFYLINGLQKYSL
jgi:hypothetical protein